MEIESLLVFEHQIDLFEVIAQDIITQGITGLCPDWETSLVGYKEESKCDICKEFFPGIGPSECNCPCTKYNSRICLEFIDQILKQSEKAISIITGEHMENAILRLTVKDTEMMWEMAVTQFKLEAGKKDLDLEGLKIRVGVLLQLSKRKDELGLK